VSEEQNDRQVFMPPKHVAEYMYAVDESLHILEGRQPDDMTPLVELTWYGEPYARLYEEGWKLL